MKQLTALLLAFMLLFSLAACGEDSTGPDNANTNSAQNEINNNDNDNQNSDENDSTSHTDSESENVSTGENEMSFTEIIAVDNDECTIKITDIDPDNIWGYTLNVQLENKSTEKTYMYSVESASINGVQCDPLFATDVAAGKKANSEINFSDSALDDNDIGDYTDIELTFRVYDSDDWSADAVAEETVHVYPYGEDKAIHFIREAQATDNIIIDNDYVTVIVTGYDDDSFWGYTVNLFLINKTDKNIMFCADDVSINGYMADPFYADEVSAGKCAFSFMSWLDTDLEDNNITTVEEIEFRLSAYDSDDWAGDDFADEVITLNP